MALCLRKLRGLQKSDRRLIDCSFIWTEPHSKRIKLKITVQQEAFAKAIVQQTFEVEFVVQNHQCPDCAKSYTPNTWRAVVQIRQKVPHKRTFFYLEQVILKHHAHLDTVSIKEAKDGLDFYYSTRANAVKMVDFLSSVVPARSKRSEELISQDVHTSVSSYKFTYSVEIVPMCREDLVCLPLKVAQQLGHIARFTLCCRVANTLRLIDPQTLQTADLPAAVYWRTPFPSLAHVGELVEFIVLDIEPVGQESGKYVLADAEVARSSDLGQNDTTFFVKTHLGAVLSAGDAVMGYHLFNSNFNHEIFETINPSNVPEVVLVKKSYPNRKKPNGRQWKLQRMAKEHNEPVVKKQEQDKLERDYELFLRELEEDSEIRQAYVRDRSLLTLVLICIKATDRPGQDYRILPAWRVWMEKNRVRITLKVTKTKTTMEVCLELMWGSCVMSLRICR